MARFFPGIARNGRLDVIGLMGRGRWDSHRLGLVDQPYVDADRDHNHRASYQARKRAAVVVIIMTC